MIEFNVRHDGDRYIIVTTKNGVQDGVRTFEDPLEMVDYFERYLIANRKPGSLR